MLIFGKSKKRTQGYRLDPALRQKVLKRDHYRCRYCGSASKLQVDHVKPRSRGGRDAMGNLVTACASCNLSKGARELPGFRNATKIRKYAKERKKARRARMTYAYAVRARTKRHWWALWLK